MATSDLVVADLIELGAKKSEIITGWIRGFQIGLAISRVHPEYARYWDNIYQSTIEDEDVDDSIKNIIERNPVQIIQDLDRLS